MEFQSDSGRSRGADCASVDDSGSIDDRSAVFGSYLQEETRVAEETVHVLKQLVMREWRGDMGGGCGRDFEGGQGGIQMRSDNRRVTGPIERAFALRVAAHAHPSTSAVPAVAGRELSVNGFGVAGGKRQDSSIAQPAQSIHPANSLVTTPCGSQ